MSLSRYEVWEDIANRVVRVNNGLTSGIYTADDAASAVEEMASLMAELAAQDQPHPFIFASHSGGLDYCETCGNGKQSPRHQAAAVH